MCTQLGPTVCDCVDCSQPDSSVHGDSPGKNAGVDCHSLLHAVSYFRVFSWPRDRTHVSGVSCLGRRIFFFLLLCHQGSPSVLEFKSKNSYLCRFPREVPWRLMGRCLSLRSQPCPHADPAPHSWAMVTASTTAAASTSATATEMSHHSSLKEHIWKYGECC